MSTTQSQLNVAFKAKLENIKFLHDVLKSINNLNNSSNDNNSIIQITNNGLKVILEDTKIIQCNLYITETYFNYFYLKNPNEMVCFSIDLNLLIDCLNIFIGSSCLMEILYKNANTPLLLIIKQYDEDNLIIECKIKTKIFNEEIMNFSLLNTNDKSDSNQVNNYLIINGSEFFELLLEMDKLNDDLKIIISPTLNFIKLKTCNRHNTINFNIKINKTSIVLIKFYSKKLTKFIYKSQHIRFIMKTLHLANKIALRTYDNGLLNLQIMMSGNDEPKMYIEYFLTPVLENDENDYDSNDSEEEENSSNNNATKNVTLKNDEL